jgi:hypothetical protein
MQGALTTCANFWFKNATIDVSPSGSDGDPVDYELDEIDDVAFFDWLNREETARAKKDLENAHADFDKAAAEFAATIRKLI